MLFRSAVNRLAPEVRKGLVAEGLIAEDGTDGKQTLWDAFWTVSTTVTRKQVFPAGRPVRVGHSYKPFAGGSVGGRFDAVWRKEADFARVRAEHCIDDTFMKGFDKRTNGGRGVPAYQEIWLSYVLTSGANWKGPIGDFRMQIDKGSANALVSFGIAGGLDPAQADAHETIGAGAAAAAQVAGHLQGCGPVGLLSQIRRSGRDHQIGAAVVHHRGDHGAADRHPRGVADREGQAGEGEQRREAGHPHQAEAEAPAQGEPGRRQQRQQTAGGTQPLAGQEQERIG